MKLTYQPASATPDEIFLKFALSPVAFNIPQEWHRGRIKWLWEVRHVSFEASAFGDPVPGDDEVFAPRRCDGVAEASGAEYVVLNESAGDRDLMLGRPASLADAA